MRACWRRRNANHLRASGPIRRPGNSQCADSRLHSGGRRERAGASPSPQSGRRGETRHPIWFLRGSRDLSHDFRPPSSGGCSGDDGSWDVIHFNLGVWDATYREATSKYFSGHNITSIEDFEKNLRTLIARMKKTGATLIWATVTPVWEGEPGKRNADEEAFNAVAAKVMKENGVIINDLNAEVRRLGYPKKRQRPQRRQPRSQGHRDDPRRP